MNEIITNAPVIAVHLTPQAAAYTLKGWIGVIGICAMALVHAYQIIVNAGGVRTIRAKFLGPKPVSISSYSQVLTPKPDRSQEQEGQSIATPDAPAQK